jgi:hypothetical protein
MWIIELYRGRLIEFIEELWQRVLKELYISCFKKGGSVMKDNFICRAGRLWSSCGYATLLMFLMINLAGAQKLSYDLSFSTYHGGKGAGSRDVATDGAGNIYVTGGVYSGLPTTDNAYDKTSNGNSDVFISKFDATGKLVWSTYLGGPNYDRAYAIEVDAKGYVYVAGRAGEKFPTTPGVIQPNFGGDIDKGAFYGAQDAFVAKLSPDGSQLIWSTYFGSDGGEIARDMDIDKEGNVYLGIDRCKRNHPHITPKALKVKREGEDAVIAKLSRDASTVLYCTYLGGSGSDGETPSIRVDNAGHLFVLMGTSSTDAPTTPGAFDTSYNGGPRDMLVSKLSHDGSSLIFSTFLGGSGYEGTETHGLALDISGNVYVFFLTDSPNLPVTDIAFQSSYSGGPGKYPWDVYVSKLSPDGSHLLAATYLGGFGEDIAEGIDVDSAENVYLSGSTTSADFPVSSDAFDKSLDGVKDGFFAKFNPDFSKLLYSTYIGGSKGDSLRSIDLVPSGAVAACGGSGSRDFPMLKSHQTRPGNQILIQFTP